MTLHYDGALPRSYEEADDRPVNRSLEPTLGDVVARRMKRRDLLKGALATTVIAAAIGPLPLRRGRASSPGVQFKEIEHGVDETHHVASGYAADVLIRWGDPVVAGAPAFDPLAQSAAAQERQFGYNNDFLGYVPLPFGSGNSDHGLLCVNHEYTVANVMFPGIDTLPTSKNDYAGMTKDYADVEMAAHGASIVEIQKGADGKWQVVADSPYGRRISTLSTAMQISGPAAGHARMKTSYDPSGTQVIGMLNNCAGGITPWGTFLTAEENFHGYFMGSTEGHPEQVNYERYGVPEAWYVWGRYHDRFDTNKEPNEANRFGWIVEINPFDPQSVPVKRTALGRFKHEGAETVVNKDGRVLIYSGDDQRFDYLYKFVSHGQFNPNDPTANGDLLDNGTLFVARFDTDGSMTWMPLVFGAGPLTPENGFASQADVLIETRRAADLLGATPMDRPEDVRPNPVTNKVYFTLTNNSKRKADQVDAVNPRAANLFGHIVELTPPDGDHGALTYAWEILVKCGDPSVAEVGAQWNPATSSNGWFASPDNCAVDARGNLWIATDQGYEWPKSGSADGLWHLATDDDGRGTGRMFFRVPVGAELCGPTFAPDDRSLFLAVQHPAVDGVQSYPGFEKESTFAAPATRWPDFDDKMPPRPSVLAITKDDGGPIGA